MKITIVTISFNQANFLERTILSVLSQGYLDLEYIIVDPGSSDGSREIINKYADRCKTVFKRDSGPSEGLNNGFALATGDIYGFLNADDVLRPGALNSVANFFEREKTIDLVSGHCLIIDPNDKVLRKSYTDPFSLYGMAYGEGVIMQASTFFRASAFKRTSGFNPENRCAWDGELFYDIYQSGGRFAIVNEFWSNFRLHENCITASKRLNAEIALYHSRLFKKIMGRDFRFYDPLIKLGFKLIKFVRCPGNLFERILRGRINGRSL